MATLLEQISETQPAKKEKKENKEKKAKKEKKDKETSPKKKRGMTGYLLFAKENRAAVKEELGETAKPTEVITEVAKRWKVLTDEERGEWNTRAKEGEEVEVEVD